MNAEIYLDVNATSPVLPAAADAALEAMRAGFGNPSSSHATGLRAKAVRERARASARRVLGAGEGRLMFNSGATEGIQTAVLSALCAVRARRAAGQPCGELVLIGATEHKAVGESLAHWNALLGTGLELRTLAVDEQGRHRLDELRALAPRTAFLCTMAANNETGVVTDIDAIERVLVETGSPALWMVDCVQALGKIKLDLNARRIDYAPFSGHKLHAPKGIGMLYVRKDAPFTPLIMGGGQEQGERSGTENMAGIAALGAVLEALEGGATFRSHEQLKACHARLRAALTAAFPGIVFNAPEEGTLPTTLNFSVPGVTSAELLAIFDAAGMRVSAGSACSAGKATSSFVLDAMGIPAWRSSSAVRLSFGLLTDDALVDEACARLARCGEALALPALPEPAFDAPAAAQAHEIELTDAAARQWLDAHPDALVIDVRDLRERSVGRTALHGRATLNVPLAHLAEQAKGWAGADAPPVLFVCRSGNRSLRAARVLRELGNHHAWSLAGGFALAS